MFSGNRLGMYGISVKNLRRREAGHPGRAGNANNRGGKQFGIADQEQTDCKYRDENQAGGAIMPSIAALPPVRDTLAFPLPGSTGRSLAAKKRNVRSGPIIAGIFRSENNPIKYVISIIQLIQAVDKLLVQIRQPRRRVSLGQYSGGTVCRHQPRDLLIMFAYRRVQQAHTEK